MHYPLQPSLLLLIQTLGGSADSINRVGSPDLRRPRASIDSVGADLRDLIQSYKNLLPRMHISCTSSARFCLLFFFGSL